MGSKSRKLRKKASPAAPRKISETIIEFADPVFDVLGEPTDLENLRYIMNLVSHCWNLPLLEQADPVEHADFQEAFLSSLATLPELVGAAFRDLLEARKTTLEEMPHWVVVEVRGESIDDARIYAEARLRP